MTGLNDPERWLGRTAFLDLESLAVRRLARDLAAGRATPRERAVAAHDWVSRNVRFGFRPAFYGMRASEVLRARTGFCNTQSTTLIALLRSMGVPARAHFVDISAEVLGGVLDPGTPYVDHSFTEVWLEGRWRRTDAYIVDPPLLSGATKRLRQAGRALGWGAHVHGVNAWDGRNDAFSQWVDDGTHPRLSTRDYGVFDDAQGFYADAGPRWNRMNPVIGLALLLGGSGIDGRIEAVRRAG